MLVSPHVFNEDIPPATRQLQAGKVSRFVLISLMVAAVLLFPLEAVWKFIHQ